MPGLRHSGSTSYLCLDVAVAEVADHRADREPLDVRGQAARRVRVHERHVLVGEAGHRAGHADPADVRAAAVAVDPAADRDVALDHRALAAELDEAARVVAVLGRELALLRRSRRGCSSRARCARTATSAAAPRRAPGPARGRRGAAPGRAAPRSCCPAGRGQPGMLTTGRPGGRLPVPAEVVGEAHRAGRVVLHRRDAAVGRAGPDRDHGGGLRRQAVDPLVRGDRLPGLGVVADRRPVALAAQLLVRDRALDARARRGRACPPRRRTTPA